MFLIVGAVMSMAAKIGRFVGMKAEIRCAHMMGSPVSGLLQDARIVFFRLYSSIWAYVNIAFPSLPAFSAYIFLTSVLNCLILSELLNER